MTSAVRILALETSTPRGGVALRVGGSLLAEAVSDLRGSASGRLLVDARALLADAGLGPADVDVFAASLGPGSFTGLRVGLATAKTLAWASGAVLVGASSLETLAAGAASAGAQGLVAPVIDARRGEVYGALFRAADGRLERLVDDSVDAPDAWAARLLPEAGDGPVCVLGDGLRRYEEAFTAVLGGRLTSPPAGTPEHPSPAALATLAGRLAEAGATLDPAAAVPNYVRPHGAVPPKDMRP